MSSYTTVVDNVNTFLISEITELTAETAQVADMDAVVDALYDDADTSVGLVLDFLYSVPHVGDSGRRVRDMWDTFIGGILLLQFDGRDDTETTKNDLLDLLFHAFDGGSEKIITGTDKVSINRIERPQKIAIGEHPFYYMAFTMMVNHGGKN